MRKHNLLPFSAIAAAVLAGGCFSLEWAVSDVTGEEHVVVGNSGYYLFNSLPLFCGNANDVNRFGGVAVFRDDVTPDKLQGRLTKRAKERGKSVYDLSYRNYNSIFFWLPLFNLPIPIPYIVTWREMQLSGVMK